MKGYGYRLAALLAILCLAFSTAFCEPGSSPKADVKPIPMDPDSIDLGNGTFWARLEDLDRIDEGWFTVMLYETDEYDPEQIMNLKPGDTLLVNGEIYTVEDIGSRDIGWIGEEDIVWEIVTEEECWGGLWFRQYGQDTFAAYLDDWIPCTFIGSVKVTLPLPEQFELYAVPGGEDPVVYTADEFTEILREDDWSIYNEYNTTAKFEDGKLVRIRRSGYPHGPHTGDEDDDDC